MTITAFSIIISAFLLIEGNRMREFFNLVVKVLLLLLSQFIHGGLIGLAAATDLELHSLLEFKKGIVGDQLGKFHRSWNPSSMTDLKNCPASWVGITCDDAGKVVSISLDHLGLEGDLKFATLVGLTMLTNLSLSGNLFRGRLVPIMGSMSSLQYLDLSDNLFYGPIPARFNQLWNLKYLNLSSNDFDGGFPSEILNLQELKFLDLHSNRLWGDIAVILSELRNVEMVDLSDNSFYGSLAVSPDNISSLTNTVLHVDISHNKLNGEFFLPDSIVLLRNLEVLDLGDNQILGELPSLRSLTNLKILRLGNNQLSGSIPDELFEGMLPLEELDLSSNEFTGILQEINCSTLNALNLSSNRLSGSLQPSLGDCISVDLSTNLMSGDISILQKWADNLVVLDLSSNNLTGSFPNSMTQFQNMFSVKLRNNSLVGALPSEMAPKLTIMDLSLNNLHGPIPRSYFSSLTLKTLNLSKNFFTGAIPFDKSPTGELLIQSSYPPLNSLDLSGNYLADTLPSDIGKMVGLSVLILARNNLAGQIPSEINKLMGLQKLDLSSNNFTGTIPDKLPSSLIIFNVSNNNLSGLVPRSLRHFPMTSFHPGNALLIFSNGFPSYNGPFDRAKKQKHGSSFAIIPVAISGASVGAVLMIIFAIFAYRRSHSQEFNGFCSQTTARDTKFGLFGRSSLSKFLPNVDPSANSLSFSDAHLLTNTNSGSLSGKPNPVTEIIDFPGIGNHPTTSGKSPSTSLLPSSSQSFDPFERTPVLDVRSPDYFAGQLFFLDGLVNFTVKHLSAAPAEVLGRSSHGTLYKASLENGHMLVVKWLKVGFIKNKKEFCKEIKIIASTRHPNIVPLHAYYWGPREQERLLLSDYINGDSLALHLYESIPRRHPPLSFVRRLKIAIDISQALLYLHDRGLPHGNLKPTNILLRNPDLDSCITDYALHRLITPSGIAEQVLTLGALGYCSPELAAMGKPVISTKDDVYAFGVIVMELLSGRSGGDIISGQSGAVDLTDWVRMCVEEGRGMDCIDREIGGDGDESLRGMMNDLLLISLRCISNERPNIRQVLEDLYSIGV